MALQNDMAAPEMFRGRIEGPGAWTALTLVGPQALEASESPAAMETMRKALAKPLTNELLAVIDELLAATRHLAPQSVKREQFSHPLLGRFLADVHAELKSGRGVCVVTGLTRARYSDEDMERVYWAFGTHLGAAYLQTVEGSHLTHVRHEAAKNREYQAHVDKLKAAGAAVSSLSEKRESHFNNYEQSFHTDVGDLLGLMCVQQAPKGGDSLVASMLTIHNVMREERPDLLEALYQGHPYAYGYDLDIRGVSSYQVPVFACIRGQVSGTYIRGYYAAAAKRLGRELPSRFVEAMDYFDAAALRPEIGVRFRMHAGDMTLANNLTVLHSRAGYEDSEDQRRHLLRLWLEDKGLRLIPTAYRSHFDYHRHARLGYYKKIDDAATAS